jgi:hypothetical protein
MRKAIAILLVGLGVLIGFPMEKGKISINYLIEFASVRTEYDSLTARERQSTVEASKNPTAPDYYYSHQTPEFLFGFSHRGLRIAKWVLAILAIVFFSALNLTVIWLWFGQKDFVRWVALGLFAIGGLSFGIFALGALFPDSKGFYAMARELLGGIQSVVPLMLMVPALRLYQYYDNPDSQFET